MHRPVHISSDNSLTFTFADVIGYLTEPSISTADALQIYM